MYQTGLGWISVQVFYMTRFSTGVLYDPKEMEAQLSKQGKRQQLMLFPMRLERDWIDE